MYISIYSRHTTTEKAASLIAHKVQIVNFSDPQKKTEKEIFEQRTWWRVVLGTRHST